MRSIFQSFATTASATAPAAATTSTAATTASETDERLRVARVITAGLYLPGRFIRIGCNRYSRKIYYIHLGSIFCARTNIILLKILSRKRVCVRITYSSCIYNLFGGECLPILSCENTEVYIIIIIRLARRLAQAIAYGAGRGLGGNRLPGRSTRSCGQTGQAGRNAAYTEYKC